MVSFIVLAGLFSLALAIPPSRFLPSRNLINEDSRLAKRSSQSYPAHTIDMPIDHFPRKALYKPHTNATFKQRYFFDSSYYKPGGPVYLYIGGEVNGEYRFSNLQTGIIQILMQATNGLGVILENRYYGESYPFANSSTDNLAYLTNEQTIADNAYFAQHATFPGVDGDLSAPKTPWILYGGSLAGAQTAFSVKRYGDILYGGICSSGVVKSIVGYSQWYDPIQKLGPQDCISYLNAIVDKFDALLATNNTAAIEKFKSLFGLESLTDNRDFASTIAFPLGGPTFYPTNTWQELNWNPPYGSDDFFNFCSNVSQVSPSSDDIASVDASMSQYSLGQSWKGLGGYTAYVKENLLPLCPSGDYNSFSCFGTQHLSAWADTSNTDLRSYLYSSCTEQGLYQSAPPTGPSLISRILQPSYTQQWCTWAFPAGTYNSIPASPILSRYNQFGGFDIRAGRLAFIDGDADVWLDVCYHSHNATVTGPREGSDLHPEYLIAGGGHHWDSYGILDVEAEPQFIREAHKWEIRTVQKWLADFGTWKPGKG